MLRVPVPDAPLDLADKVEATILNQMTEVADQVCDGMLVSGATVLFARDCVVGLGGLELPTKRLSAASSEH